MLKVLYKHILHIFLYIKQSRTSSCASSFTPLSGKHNLFAYILLLYCRVSRNISNYSSSKGAPNAIEIYPQVSPPEKTSHSPDVAMQRSITQSTMQPLLLHPHPSYRVVLPSSPVIPTLNCFLD